MYKIVHILHVWLYYNIYLIKFGFLKLHLNIFFFLKRFVLKKLLINFTFNFCASRWGMKTLNIDLFYLTNTRKVQNSRCSTETITRTRIYKHDEISKVKGVTAKKTRGCFSRLVASR